MESLIKHVELLLLKYRVNIGFYGHNHVVQRQSAVYNSKVIQKSIKILNDNGDIVNTFNNPQATVHMVIGTAGAGFTKNANDDDNKPEWNEMFFYKWGYTRIIAINATNLSWEWVESSSGIICDRMAINQLIDFDINPHWIINLKNSTTNNLSSSNNIINHKLTINNIYNILCTFFQSIYGVIFVFLFISLIMFTFFYYRYLSSSSTSSSSPDLYVKLPSSNALCATILESHQPENINLYREVL